VQFTGGTSFQRSLNDLVKTNGVDASVRYDDDDTVDASSTLDEGASSASAQTPEGTVPSSQPGMLGYVEGFPTNLNVYGFGKDATEAGEKVREVTDRVLRSIDGGNRGAYVIAHHINTPGVLMLQKHLEKFRDALEKRNCALSIVTTVREPVMHRVSELLKFFPAPLEKDLKSVLKNEPAFPEAKGATPFKQLREFLFMDQFDVAKEQIGTTAGVENAGDGAGEAIEANALFEAVTRAAERRGLAVDAFLEEGVFDDADLTEEERSVIGTSPAEASQKFDAALNAVVRVADDLIRTFDITLVRTEDQGEGLERLANKMDWHPELMQTEGTDAFETAQRNARDVMNAHTFTSDEDEVDVDLLPFSLRKSLHTWTELDLALYALAAAQAERFRTTRDSPENGAEPDCPPPNLLDAYALAKAARPDAARVARISFRLLQARVGDRTKNRFWRFFSVRRGERVDDRALFNKRRLTITTRPVHIRPPFFLLFAARRVRGPRPRGAQHDPPAHGQAPYDRALRPGGRPRAHLEVVLLRAQHDEGDVRPPRARGEEERRGLREPVPNGRAPVHRGDRRRGRVQGPVRGAH